MTSPDLSAIEPMPVGDIRGWLAINNLPPEYQRAEDSTAANDRDCARMRNPRGHSAKLPKPSGSCWRTSGFELPEQLTTKITWPSRSVRRRTWPQLEES